MTEFGEEGVGYTTDPEVCAQYTNPYIENGMYEKINVVKLEEYWSKQTNVYWHSIHPKYQSYEDSDT